MRTHQPNQPKQPKHPEQHPHGGKSENSVDAAVEGTFPASDPPSIGGTTKIKPRDEHEGRDDGSASSHPTMPRKHH
ncbi:protein of unknown function [Pararobbsia alpina]|uniref:hypothetical protein n=1 Tax=Pararobbsia alpina TaxID=621374 RepID=UPI0039A49CE5